LYILAVYCFVQLLQKIEEIKVTIDLPSGLGREGLLLTVMRFNLLAH
jgi:hypothetical protein